MDTILVVEDQKENSKLYKDYVDTNAKNLGMQVAILDAASFEEAEERLKHIQSNPNSKLLLVLLDMELPFQGHKDRRAGYKLMRQYQQNFPATHWIPLTATIDLNEKYPNQPSLFEELFALQPFAVLTKGNLYELETIIYKALKSILELSESGNRSIEQKLSETVIRFQDSLSQKHFYYVTQSYELFHQIRMVAEKQCNVLLFGECGTGKTLTAHLIHYYSAHRHKQPFQTVEGLLEADLLESLLFPERNERPGSDQRSLLGKAHNGTLYISDFDKMGNAGEDVAYKLQNRLLYFMSYRDYNVRIIGGITHPKRGFLSNESILPAFSKDVSSLELPPLQERKDDIPDLVRLFVQQFNQERKEVASTITGQLQLVDEKPKELLDEEQIYALLKDQSWQNGNISQLRKLIDDVLLNTLTSIITVDDFRRVLQSQEPVPTIRSITELKPDLRKKDTHDEEQTETKLPKKTKSPVVVTTEDLRRFGFSG